MNSSTLRFALIGCVVGFALSGACAAMADERMAGPIPVSRPDPDAKPATIYPREADERMAGTKKETQSPEEKPTEKKSTEKPVAKKTVTGKATQGASAKPSANSAKKIDTPAPTPNTPRPKTGNIMDPKALDSLGPMTNPLLGSLGNDMWSGSDRATLLTYIPLLPAGNTLRPAQLLARRVLLSNGDVNMLKNNASKDSDPDLFTLRIEKLLEMGAYDDAVALYTLIEGEPANDRLGHAGVMTLMYGGYPAQACLEARTVHHDPVQSESGADADSNVNSNSAFWQQIGAICTFIEIESAQNMSSGSTTSGKEKGFDRSVITGIPGSRILTTLSSRLNYRYTVGSVKDIEELSDIERAVIKGLGRFDYTRLKLKKADDIPSPVLMIMATDPNMPKTYRAALNVEAARRGVISADQLGDLYIALSGLDEKQVDTDSPALRLWDRYALYAKSTDDAEKKRIVSALLDTPAHGLPTALLPFAETVSAITPDALSKTALKNGIVLMLYANIVPSERWVKAWLKTESGDSVKSPDSIAIYLANILLEDLPTKSTAFPDEALNPVFEDPKSPKSLEIWSLFSGLGRQNVLHNIPSRDIYEKDIDLTATNDYVMPIDGLQKQIQEASDNGRLGEVALLAAVALNEYSPGKTHPGVFRDVLQSLITVGLKEEAQQMALGVVLSLEQ